MVTTRGSADTVRTRSPSLPGGELGRFFERDEVEEQETPTTTWKATISFLVKACTLSSSFTFLWRFSFQLYIYEGGDFVFPVLGMFFALAIPILHLELVIGHHLPPEISLPAAFESMAPTMKGVGYSMTVLCFFVSLYHVTILTWLTVAGVLSGIEGEKTSCVKLPSTLTGIATESCHSEYDDILCRIRLQVMDLTTIHKPIYIYNGLQCRSIEEFCNNTEIFCKGESIRSECHAEFTGKYYDYDPVTGQCVNGSRTNGTNGTFEEGDLLPATKAALFSHPVEDLILSTFARDISLYEILPSLWWVVLSAIFVWAISTYAAMSGALVESEGVRIAAVVLQFFTVLILCLYAVRYGNWKSYREFFAPTEKIFSEPGIWAGHAAQQVLLGLGLGMGCYFALPHSASGPRKGSFWEPLIIACVPMLLWTMFGLYLFEINGKLASVTNKLPFETMRINEFFPFVVHTFAMDELPLGKLLIIFSAGVFLTAALNAVATPIDNMAKSLEFIIPTLSKQRYLTYIVPTGIGFCFSMVLSGPQGIFLLIALDNIVSLGAYFTCFCELAAILFVVRYDRIYTKPGPEANIFLRIIWYIGLLYYQAVVPLIFFIFLVIYLFSTRLRPMISKFDLPAGYFAVTILGWVLIISPTVVHFAYSTGSAIWQGDKLTPLFQPSEELEESLGSTFEEVERKRLATLKKKEGSQSHKDIQKMEQKERQDVSKLPRGLQDL